MCMQGGRSWHPFGEGKNDHKNVRQACIYFFRDKCVIYARNYKLANLAQNNLQYPLCNNAFLSRETLFLTPKTLLLPKDFQTLRKSRQILISDKLAYVRG